jgi:SAM-dependent methyltransferase
VATGRESLSAIRSVLDQSLHDLELVVVAVHHDDGLERGLELLGDPRVVLLEQQGATRTRGLNLGLLASRGRWLAYQSESSLYRPEHVERLVHFLESERLGFAYSDLGLATHGVPGSATLGREFDSEALLRENYIPAESVIHRRDLLHDVGLFNEGLEEGAEWELWAHLTRLTPTRRLAEVTVERMVGGAKASKLITPSPARVRRYLAQKFNRPAEPAEDGQALEREMDGDVARAHQRWRRGDLAGAAADILDAAARPFAALTRLFSPPYPAREAPALAAGFVAAESNPALFSRPRPPAPSPPAATPARRAAMPASAQEPLAESAAAGQQPSLLSPAAGPLPRLGREPRPEPYPETVEAETEVEAEPEEATRAEVALDAAAADGASRSRPAAWICTPTGLVGAGRRLPSSRTVRPASSRPLYSGPSFASRRMRATGLVHQPPCPMCSQPEPAVAHRIGWIRILDCSSCGTAFSQPRLEPSLAVRFFSDRRPEVVPPMLTTDPDLRSTPYDRSRELSWVTRHVRQGRLIEVGCSWGYTLLQARALGFEAFGTELSRTLARAARDRFGLEVFEKDFVDLGLDDESLDVVLGIHVVQHLSDPRAFFEKAARALRPGGVLVGSVPNFDAYLREVMGRRWRWLDPESQPFHFRPSSLGRELQAAGFQVEMWTSEGLYGDAAALEFLTPEQVADAAREGRGSELGFVALKR